MTTVKMVKLGTLIKPAKLQKCGNDDYPVLSMTMHNGLVFQSDKFKKSVASQDKSTYKVVHRNQLVIGFPIDEGVLATQRITDVGIVSPAYGIWDVDQTKIIPEFLEYALRCNRAIDYYKAKLRGSTARRRSLPTPTLLELDVPLPDIEQQRLALTTIHHAKNALDSRQAQITKLDELVKARFVEMFGDFEFNPKKFPIYLLCNLCDVGSSKRIYQEEQSTSGIPFLKISDLVDLIDAGTFSASTFIPSDRYERLCSQGLTPKTNDVLITSRGTLGKCYIVKKSDEFYFQDGMISWLSNISEKVSSTYISYLFMQPYIQKQILALQAGSTVAYLSISMLKRLNIILPPLSLQNQFSDFVAEVDKSKLLAELFAQSTCILAENRSK